MKSLLSVHIISYFANPREAYKSSPEDDDEETLKRGRLLSKEPKKKKKKKSAGNPVTRIKQ